MSSQIKPTFVKRIAQVKYGYDVNDFREQVLAPMLLAEQHQCVINPEIVSIEMHPDHKRYFLRFTITGLKRTIPEKEAHKILDKYL